jgi:streptogramin lyase
VVAAVAAVVTAAIATPLLALGSARASAAVSLVRIDGTSGRVSRLVRDGLVGRGRWANLWSVGGTLWQLVGANDATIAERNISTGRVVKTLPLDADVCTCRVAIDVGSVWVARERSSTIGGFAVTRSQVERIDEISGRRSVLSVPGVPSALSTGNGSVWMLEQDGVLIRIDPLENRVSASFKRIGFFPGGTTGLNLYSAGGYEWISNNEFCCAVTRVDPSSGKEQAFPFPARGEVVGGQSPHGPGAWVLDQQAATLAEMDPSSGQTSQSIGLDGPPQQAVVAFGAVWVAAGPVVDRIDLQTQQRTTITLPHGVWAGSITADPTTTAIWVGNSLEPPPRLRLFGP